MQNLFRQAVHTKTGTTSLTCVKKSVLQDNPTFEENGSHHTRKRRWHPITPGFPL